ncbi:MAG TPA: hypothetical protein VIM11_15550 [Tepidisphaeraceae bacterium]|jgi:hypothetical protein
MEPEFKEEPEESIFQPMIDRAMEAMAKDPLWIACQRKRWTDSVTKAALDDHHFSFWCHWAKDSAILGLGDEDFKHDFESIRRGQPSARMRGEWPNPDFRTKPNKN